MQPAISSNDSYHSDKTTESDVGKRQSKSVGQVSLKNGDEQMDPEFAEVGEKKKQILQPRTYLVNGPGGSQLIKADTPARVSRHVMQKLGYSIEVPNKELLIELLTEGGLKVEDISQATA